jgi:hypothetical protein
VSSFNVNRAPLEMYLAHSSLKAGQKQSLTVLSSRDAHVPVSILYPDGRYGSHTIKTDSKGKGEYSFTVQALHGHPKSRTVTIQALVSHSSIVYGAVTHFTVH